MKSKVLVILAVVTMLFIFPWQVAWADFLKVDGYIGMGEEPNVVSFTGVKSFPYNLTLFGFVNFITEEREKDDENDFATYYGETNLTMDIWRGWGVIAELNDGSEVDSLIRCGISYRPPFPFLKDYGLQLRLLPYCSDSRGGQISLSFHKDITERFFVEGWADLDLWYGDSDQPDTTYMTELQVGVKIKKNLYAVVEYRINDFMEGRDKTDDACGIGLEYRF